MTNKVHDISDLPKDAPRVETTDNDATVDPAAPGRLKTFLHTHKKFFVGLGTGVAVGVAALGLAKAASEQEDEEIETTPEV